METINSPLLDFLVENEKGTKKILHAKLIYFLEDMGFNHAILDGRLELIRNTNGIIRRISIMEIIDFVRTTLEDNEHKEYIDVFAEGPSRYVGPAKLSLLRTVDLINDRDPRNSSRFYFQNCFCEVSAESIIINSYDKLQGSIWENRIIKREYKKSKKEFVGQFHQWSMNITGNNPQRFRALQSFIGYLLHRNKERGENKAIILYDEKMSEDGKANGRVGKTLLGMALGHCREVVMNDAKTKNFKSDFANELVSSTTDCVYYDDLPKSTNFENFYSFITTGVEVNKKYKAAFRIEDWRSPKLIISSNYYVLGDGGDSDRARRYEFEISNYYSADFTPEQEFGNRFWDSKWPESEWNNFFEFMMKCLQIYLKEGLIEVEPINLTTKKIKDSTSAEFLEFAAAFFTIGEKLDKRELETNFKFLYPRWKHLSPHGFHKWCGIYALNTGLNYRKWPSGGDYYCEFTEKFENDRDGE